MNVKIFLLKKNYLIYKVMMFVINLIMIYFIYVKYLKYVRFVFCIVYCIDIDLFVNGDDKWWLRIIDFLEI